MTWVPSLAVGVGVGTHADSLLQLRGQAEMAYRPTRKTSLFARICAEVGDLDGLPMTVSLVVGYRWHSSLAGDLDF